MRSELESSKLVAARNALVFNMNQSINLNNLETSLTKELDRSILSTLNTKKHEDRPQLKFDSKYDPLFNESLLESSRIQDTLKGQLSPTAKVERVSDYIAHMRHSSNPDNVFDMKHKADK